MMKVNKRTGWGMVSLIALAGLAVLMCKAHGAGTAIYPIAEPDSGLRVWTLHVPLPETITHGTGEPTDGRATLKLGFDKVVNGLTPENFLFEGTFEPPISAYGLGNYVDIMDPALLVENVPEVGSTVKVSIIKKIEYTFDPFYYIWDTATGIVTAGPSPSDPSPKLTGLVVEYINEAGNLINFFPTIKTYVIHAETGRSVKVSKAEWPEGTPVITHNDAPLAIDEPVAVPAAGAEAKVIYITVTDGGLSSEYRVIIAPPQNNEPDDRDLTYLAVFYENEWDNLISFSKSLTEYTVNVSEQKQSSKVRLDYLFLSSSLSAESVTYGVDDEHAAPVAKGALVDVPAPGTSPKKFFITVRSGNANTKRYIITIYPYTPVADTTLWNGTVRLDSLSDKTAVQVIARAADIYQSHTAAVTDWNGTLGNWTLVAPKTFVPVSFIVAITDNDTFTEVSRSRQYKPYVETQVHLVVDGPLDVGKGVFSYQDVADFTNHPDLNYSLVDDVTLADDWSGSPENYSARFYGNGYTIKNLRFTSIKAQYYDGWCQGLFKSLGPSAQIHDLTILVPDQSITITSSGYDEQTFFGAVTSYTDSLNIVFNGVTVRGSLTIGPESQSRHFSIGGFFGQLGLAYEAPQGSSATFINCVSDMDITIDGGQPTEWSYDGDNATKAVGGFVGYVWASGVSFTNCYSTGSINAKISPAQGGVVIGGFVSGAGGGGTTVITNCYSSVALDSDWYSNKWATIIPQDHVVGGFFGTVEENYNVNISKTLALNPYINVSKGTIKVGRVIGNPKAPADSFTRSYSDLYALESMAVTSNGTGVALDDTTSTGKNGESKSASALNEIFWLSKDFSDTVWDFSPLSSPSGGWPKLK
jgi:hypothetical protein